MLTRASISTILLAPLALPASVWAQSNVDLDNKFSWSENCGWMNWRDADATNRGAFLSDEPSVLSGLVWCENVGYINLGGGAPANGINYTNTSGADFGVNVLSNDLLQGYAWGENIGWVNFGVFGTLDSTQQARYDAETLRFRGFAWGENVGWINLDNVSHYVAIAPLCAGCPADYNQNGGVEGSDISAFFSDYEQGLPCADVDHNGGIDGADLAYFFAVYEAGGC